MKILTKLITVMIAVTKPMREPSSKRDLPLCIFSQDDVMGEGELAGSQPPT